MYFGSLRNRLNRVSRVFRFTSPAIRITSRFSVARRALSSEPKVSRVVAGVKSQLPVCTVLLASVCLSCADLTRRALYVLHSGHFGRAVRLWRGVRSSKFQFKRTKK